MNEIILFSPPRCGMHYVLQAIACLSGNSDVYSDRLYTSIPFYQSKSEVDIQQKIWASHSGFIAYDDLLKLIENDDQKLISVYRHPLDVLISRYFYYVHEQEGGERFGEYYEKNFTGIIEEIYNHCDLINQLGAISICYEYCLLQPEELIQVLCEILSIEVTTELKNMTLETLSVGHQKTVDNNQDFFLPSANNGPMIRQGIPFLYQSFFDADIIDEMNSTLSIEHKTMLLKLGYSIALD